MSWDCPDGSSYRGAKGFETLHLTRAFDRCCFRRVSARNASYRDSSTDVAWSDETCIESLEGKGYQTASFAIFGADDGCPLKGPLHPCDCDPRSNLSRADCRDVDCWKIFRGAAIRLPVFLARGNGLLSRFFLGGTVLFSVLETPRFVIKFRSFAQILRIARKKKGHRVCHYWQEVSRG